MPDVIATRVASGGLGLLLLAGAGAGCAGEPPPAPPSSPAQPTLPKDPAPLPGSTPAGARLRFGDKAVITVGTAEDPSRVGVLVTGVDKATEQDMTALRSIFGEQITRWAYLIRVVLVNEDGHQGYSGYSGPTLSADGDIGSARLLNTNLILPSCTDYSTPPGGWTTPGARFETCRVVFTDPARVTYSLGRAGSISWVAPS